MPIRYTRVGWQDAPSTETPIDAANLNHMDNGILAISQEFDTELPLIQEQIGGISANVDARIDETMRYINVSTPNVRTVVSVYNYVSTLSDDAELSSLQGAAYNSKEDEYVVAIISADNHSKCRLVVVDCSDGCTIKKRSEVFNDVLGHANDIAYNSATDKYYVLTGSQGTYKNKVAVIDATTLAYINSYQLQPETIENTDDCNWVIDYDAYEDVYVTFSYNKIQRYDRDFNLISELPINDLRAVGLFTHTGCVIQSGCSYAPNMFAVLGLAKLYAPNQYDSALIMFFDITSGKLVRSVPIKLTHFEDEPEGIYIRDGVIYLVDGQKYFMLRQVLMQKNISGSVGDDIFYIGRQLLSGSNLNSHTIPGKYISASSVISAEIANAPFSGAGFTLLVMNSTYNGISQLAISSSGDLAIRVYQPNNDTWTEWNYMLDTNALFDPRLLNSIDIKLGNDVVGKLQYIKLAGSDLYFGSLSITLGRTEVNAGTLNGMKYSNLVQLVFDTQKTLSGGAWTLSVAGGGMFGIAGITGSTKGINFRIWNADGSTIGAPAIVGNGTFNMV